MKTSNVLLLSLILVLVTSTGVTFANETLDEYCMKTKSLSRLLFCDALQDHELRLLALEDKTINKTIKVPQIKCETKLLNGDCINFQTITLDIEQNGKRIKLKGMSSESGAMTVIIKDYRNNLKYIDQVIINKRYVINVNTELWDEGLYFIKVNINDISKTSTIYYK